MLYHQKVWGVLMLGWLSLYMVRVGMAPLLKPIMQEFDLSYSQAGLLSSAIFWAYTLMQMPSGFLGDKWGHKRFLLVGTFCWTVLCFFTGLVHSFVALIIIRFFTGMAQGTYFGNDRPMVAYYTPPSRMATGQGVSALGMGIGMGLGILIAGYIAEIWGWRWVFFCYTIPSLLAFLLVWKVIREPADTTDRATEIPEQKFSVALTNPRLLLLYLSHFAVMYVFWVLGVWAPTILMDIGAAGLGRSGVYASVIGLIAVPALLGSGAISDKLRNKHHGSTTPLLVSTISLVVLSLGMGLSLDFGTGPLGFAGLLLLTGAAVWGFFPPFYAMLAETASPRILGTTFGAANTAGFMASLVAPWVTGLLRDVTLGFSWSFYACALISIVGVVSTFLAGRTREPARR